MKRILLIENHAVMRHSLSRLIEAEEDFEVCASGANGREGLQLAKETGPDLAIVDLFMQDRHGLEVIADIRSLDPRVGIVVLSMHDEFLYAERALRAGARGYVMKEMALEALIPAVRRVLAGEIYLSERMTRLMPKLLTDRRGQDSG